MIACDQPTITGRTFNNLVGIFKMMMYGCTPAQIAAALALGLPVVNF